MKLRVVSRSSEISHKLGIKFIAESALPCYIKLSRRIKQVRKHCESIKEANNMNTRRC